MNWWYTRAETMPRVLLSRAFKWHETWQQCEEIQGAWHYSMHVDLYKEYCDKVESFVVESIFEDDNSKLAARKEGLKSKKIKNVVSPCA
jgi:hypothetical protein